MNYLTQVYKAVVFGEMLSERVFPTNGITHTPHTRTHTRASFHSAASETNPPPPSTHTRTHIPIHEQKQHADANSVARVYLAADRRAHRLTPSAALTATSRTPNKPPANLNYTHTHTHAPHILLDSWFFLFWLQTDSIPQHPVKCTQNHIVF